MRGEQRAISMSLSAGSATVVSHARHKATAPYVRLPAVAYHHVNPQVRSPRRVLVVMAAMKEAFSFESLPQMVATSDL